MMVQKPTPEKLIGELNLARYISKPDERQNVIDKSKQVLASQDTAADRLTQVEGALAFIKTVWTKYDCEEVADLYDKFAKIEEALFGLEREEESGNRYRDHFIHMFNCFVFGLRIIEAVISQTTEVKAKELFRTDDENLKKVGVPFSSNYKYHERLFYLWTLTSTFHDIAIPFQHLARLGKGISTFVEEFGWVFTDPSVQMLNFDSSQLHYYFNVLGDIYGGRLQVIDEGRKYKRPKTKQYYLAKLLGREFDRRNHGVLSGFFMWKTIEEIFLVGRSKKYRDKFGVEQFDRYAEYVLEQDVARAALAISLHGIGEDVRSKVHPKVFPIDFGAYPLAFLLILADELQEYLRWEGTTVRGEVNITSHPILNTSFEASDNTISVEVSFSIAGNDEEAVVKWAEKRALHAGLNSAIENLAQAIDCLGSSIKKSLERKLKLGENFRLKLNIYRDWDERMYSEDFASPK